MKVSDDLALADAIHAYTDTLICCALEWLPQKNSDEGYNLLTAIKIMVNMDSLKKVNDSIDFFKDRKLRTLLRMVYHSYWLLRVENHIVNEEKAAAAAISAAAYRRLDDAFSGFLYTWGTFDHAWGQAEACEAEAMVVRDPAPTAEELRHD